MTKEKTENSIPTKGEMNNLLLKLQQARVEVLGEIKKATRGYGYDYFSNDDILPTVNEVLNKNGLCSYFKIEEREKISKTIKRNEADKLEEEISEHTYSYWGILVIANVNNPDDSLKFEMPTCLANVKGASAIQNFGAMQTWTKRYLYLNALEIASIKDNEGDIKDTDVEKSTDEERKAKEKVITKKITDEQLKLIKSKLEGDDLKNICQYYNVEKLEDMTIVQASDCLKNME